MKNTTIICSECAGINTISLEDRSLSFACSTCKEELNDPFPVEVDDTSCALHIQHSDIPLLLDFYSTVCGPCMAMYDDYEDAALEFPLQVRFLKINADKHQNIAKKYNVGALPTIIAIHKGEEINRISKQLSRIELTLWATNLLDSTSA